MSGDILKMGADVEGMSGACHIQFCHLASSHITHNVKVLKL
jgi:hypothetical protein